ncbi:hypothetical protein PIB30_085535, partial [Stylosanthes scabra]|nr:hypothetical protein [Stylosanthes scabra]
MNTEHGLTLAENSLGGHPIQDSINSGNEMGNSGPQIRSGDAKISFRDKLIGDSAIKTLAFADTLAGEKVAKIDTNTEDDIPAVSFTEEARDAFNEPYKEVVIIKVLGKHVSYT